ncbi:putative glycosyltransferase [Hyella patelloides LEGE 07179]|uniref:Putative glycosyltransferase n=1 Tax=Hyella patelloides LEGE 07179 TaxID=945734 RepID=A0A563W454_9CYAN|nr:tetratricopeptide repeat protein [Hyella patelloides]VEP18323.1 putative glycosyltransferase [Hyella patelloides LEGE 07179]
MVIENNKQGITEKAQDYQTYYSLGQELAKEQKWQKAIANYQKAVQLKDDIAEIYHYWGDALINLKSWQKAVKNYEKAIILDSNFAWSYYNLGVALFNLGKIKKAVAAHEKAIAINSKNPQFQYSLGQALANLGQWQTAADTYQIAINLGWQKPQTYHELGDIFCELGQWNDAIEAYQSAIKLNSNTTWSYHNLGVALFKLELFQEAVTFFQQALNIDSNFVSAYYYLGSAFRLQHKWDEAVTAYRQAAKIQPDFPDLQDTLADTLQQRARADLDSALLSYHQLLETTDNPGKIQHKIAVILAEKQLLDRALFYSGTALEFEPENSDYRAFYTKICQQRSKLYEFAVEYAIADRSYGLWCKDNTPTVADLRLFCLRLADIAYKPTISIILPLQESAAEWIQETIATIQQQIYPHWQLCIATATVNSNDQQYWQEASKLTSIVEYCIKGDFAQGEALHDRRINYISCDPKTEMAELANRALAAATGEWIAILQPETLLTPDALLEFVRQLARDNTADIVYGDEDRLKKGKLLSKPYFKPEWCPDLLLTRNYFGSLVLCRHSLVKDIAGFSNGYGDAYRYDLLIRLTEKTQHISHIARILSHSKQQTRQLEDSNKVITETLKRRGETGRVISNLDFPEIKTIRYEITQHHLVSIIIPTRNLGKMLDECLTSIFELTTYNNYEVIIVDNGSNDPETLAIIEQWQNKAAEKLKLLKLDIPFNYSRLNNHAVAKSQGKYLLFLNNDTKIITADWLEAMIEQAQRPTIGAVGALLLYPDNTIQHAGVILGVTGIAAHGHRNYPLSDSGYNHSLLTTTNYSAVTSACLMCRREVFTEVRGFNEQLAVAYNDVDFCLKLQQQDYYNVWLPHVKLYHYESQTRTPETTPKKQKRISQEIAYMEDTWSAIINHDPCYNRNLTREEENYSLNSNHQAEIKAIFLSEVSQQQLWGFFIDQPKPGCLKDNSLDIIGWVIGRIAKVISLEVTCDDEMIATTEINRNRPDVALAYPHLIEASNSGFVTTIDLKTLPHEAELSLQVVLANDTKVRLGKVQLG